MRGTMTKKHDKTNVKKTNQRIWDAVFLSLIVLVLSASLIFSSLSFIYIQHISQSIDLIKKNVWSLKTSAYDTGSLSFFNGEIEATKKDIKDGSIIKGELINRTNKRIEEAKITFKVYDQDGALIDASSDSIKAWDSGEKWIYNAKIEDNNSLKYEFAELSIIY